MLNQFLSTQALVFSEKSLLLILKVKLLYPLGERITASAISGISLDAARYKGYAVLSEWNDVALSKRYW
jgi:hypothetical protein